MRSIPFTSRTGIRTVLCLYFFYIGFVSHGQNQEFVPSEQTVEWHSDIYTAGTAVDIELWRSGSKLEDFGMDWGPNGFGQPTLILPADLPPGDDYRIRIVSVYDPQYWAESARFRIQGR